jgi:hypothetical protein
VLGRTPPIRRSNSSTTQLVRTWGRQDQVETGKSREEARRASPERRDRDASRRRWDSSRYQGTNGSHGGQGWGSRYRSQDGRERADVARRVSAPSRGHSSPKGGARRTGEREIGKVRAGRGDQTRTKSRDGPGPKECVERREGLKSAQQGGEQGLSLVPVAATAGQRTQASVSDTHQGDQAVTELVVPEPAFSGLAWPPLGELDLLPEEAGLGQQGDQSSENSMGLDLFDESWLVFGEPWDG